MIIVTSSLRCRKTTVKISQRFHKLSYCKVSVKTTVKLSQSYRNSKVDSDTVLLLCFCQTFFFLTKFDMAEAQCLNWA